MSYKSQSTTDLQVRKPVRRPGRTLLVKYSEDSKDSKDSKDFDTSQLEGLQTKQTTLNNSHFLTFSTSDFALSALKQLKKQYGPAMRLKFAHYRIYFTMLGLEPDTDYNIVKNTHTALVTKTVDCNVLYYRLYRKNNNYLGCGEMTVDTKDGFVNIMKMETLKNFVFGDFSGVHYRYNKTKTTTNEITESTQL